MATFLRMPGVSADSDEALLDKWYPNEGDTVRTGEQLICVETEKALVDVDAEADCVVHKIIRSGGETVAVGDAVGVLLEPGEDAAAGDELVAQLGGQSGGGESAPTPEPRAGGQAQAKPESGAVDVARDQVDGQTAAQAEDMASPDEGPEVFDEVGDQGPSGASAASREEAPARAPSSGAGGEGERLFVSPLARKMAAEHDLDLHEISGSGPRGRIRKVDIQRVLESRAGSFTSAQEQPTEQPTTSQPSGVIPEGGTAVPNSKLRRLVASRLQQSKREAPHFYLKAALRMDALLDLRAQLNAAGGSSKISVNDLFVKGAARALVEVPAMNVTWTDEATITYERVDVAVAVASDKGLVTPVFTDVANTSVAALSVAVKDAVARANEGRLQQSQLQGGTMTISNLGMYGVDEFSAIINPPQASILAVGAAKPEVVVGGDGQPTVCTVCRVVLSVDHRPADGAIAAQWLQRFVEIIEHPLQILL